MEQEIGKKPYWKELPESIRKIFFNFIFWLCVGTTPILIYLQAYSIGITTYQNENYSRFIAEYLNNKLFCVLLIAAFIYYLFCSFANWVTDQIRKTNNSSSSRKYAWEELFSQAISIGSIVNAAFFVKFLTRYINPSNKFEIDISWWAGLAIWTIAVVIHNTANQKD